MVHDDPGGWVTVTQNTCHKRNSAFVTDRSHEAKAYRVLWSSRITHNTEPHDINASHLYTGYSMTLGGPTGKIVQRR